MQLLAERVEVDGLLEVGHGVGVVRQMVVGHTAIMVSAHIQWMYLQGAAEVVDGTCVVTKTELGYAAQEIPFEIIWLGHYCYVEVLDGV